jgi:hypothetical protein
MQVEVKRLASCDVGVRACAEASKPSKLSSNNVVSASICAVSWVADTLDMENPLYTDGARFHYGGSGFHRVMSSRLQFTRGALPL